VLFAFRSVLLSQENNDPGNTIVGTGGGYRRFRMQLGIRARADQCLPRK
jgi:hypothetical protein